MASRKILVLPGDGVGPEIIAEAVKVLEVIQKSSGVKFEIRSELMGGCSIDKHGVALTQEVLDEAKASDAVLFGSVGGPKWGAGKVRPEQGVLALRHGLNAFANLRPCKFASKSLVDRGPIRPELTEGTDFILVRENCGGAYFGDKTEEEDFASDAWAYSRAEIERVAKVAADLAMETEPPQQVISCDKANVLAVSRLWRRAVTEFFAREYPQIKLSHQLADSAAMLMVKDPRSFNGVVLMDNTFGDILSDVSSVVPGSLGLLPSASISSTTPGSGGIGLYEPIHGSAPDIAGKGIANPVATILAAAMMLRYSFGMVDEAKAIDKAVEKVLDSRDIGGHEIRTPDLGGSATTVEVGNAICRQLESLLK
ncbi:3-isopropylmalate dehydrogenase [Colletotrichum abscissum]|uniref:3-isopropylmalate dehydrogenase n=1 Tax=Colletotrichum abscissum TaxID=1671311 RepID=A0A9P9XSH2_9PEZI|nr:3-isopropylmalate dehydrogenase [Colletotrichum abscissum]KAI3559657.1 3-isopropylmalate dehydrogenase [Colletotrichum abscissum]KAK1486163.1 3-isopropylmalate dehydrogenase [Colletotrichum abscissum]